MQLSNTTNGLWKTDYQVLLKYVLPVRYGQEIEQRTDVTRYPFLNKIKRVNVVEVDLIKRR